MSELRTSLWHSIRINPQLWIGGAAFAAIVAIAALAPWLAGHDPMEQDLLSQHLPPFWLPENNPSFPLGTDSLGRDILSRLIWGTRPVLLVMVLGATLSGMLGVVVGLLSGHFGGWLDDAIGRLIEVFMSFPPMLLAIVLVAVTGPGLDAVVMAIVLIGWTRFARVIRGEVLVLREQDFITAARVLGYGHRRILFRELMPNIAPIALALFALEMGRAIVVEAVLAFIGFSASDVPTWGGIIADGRSYVYQAWWVMTLPVICIMISVLALSMFADGLRKAIDPMMQR
ncbi:ABC transporter permease [Roseiarcaceae bacterium H3SJ34-1]|uniref:ABC transporter permease n=1 Tax=Terripilifer ovatus TaxID=3032367 RepID=UPI003AB935E8|nr:ABC transporter permease [Roseiarcaceae bacterium H3SJ34-1]